MNAPTIFVGLGGTGSRIVAMLEEWNRGSKENLGFAVFDTDANELKKLQRKGSKSWNPREPGRRQISRIIIPAFCR